MTSFVAILDHGEEMHSLKSGSAPLIPHPNSGGISSRHIDPLIT